MSFFSEQIRTSKLMSRLFKTHDLPVFFQKNESFIKSTAFSDYITQLCRERELVPERIVILSQIERTYGHQLFNGTRKPSRDKVLQLAFGFGLNVEETQHLLRVADKSLLYPKIKRDAIIIYCLAHGKNLFETQDTLNNFNLTLLGGDVKYGN